jgi:hypothetical protein
MPLADSDATAFATFGFVVLRNVLTATECRAIAAEFTTAFACAYPDLPQRRTPAWLPGLGDATPCSASLTVDDGRLWTLARHLLGADALPCPPEVAWLRGLTPWHYDDPLGLRGVKFIVYVDGPADGLRLLPMSHAAPQRDAVQRFLAAPGATAIEAVERDLVPSVSVRVEPGDVAAIDLHLWHCYRVRHPRILWAPEYLAWPVGPAPPESLERKFAAVAAAGVLENGQPAWPVWRDWLVGATGQRRLAIDLLRRAGAFDAGRDLS